MAMLIEKLDELLADQEQLPQEGWQIDGLNTAVWADEKVRAAEDEIREVNRIADERIAAYQAKIDKINEWRVEGHKKPQATIDFFKPHLLMFLGRTIREQIEAGAKKIEKSIKLPFRTLQAKAQQPEIIKNEEALLDWMDHNAPEFVEYKPKLLWSEFKKTLKMAEIDGKLVYIDQSGEVVPYVTLTKRGDALDWTVSE